jgi:hypothetical protein
MPSLMGLAHSGPIATHVGGPEPARKGRIPHLVDCPESDPRSMKGSFSGQRSGFAEFRLVRFAMRRRMPP